MNKKENKINILIDNIISSMKIHEKLDKKLIERIKLMPEIKKNYDFVAKDETSIEANYFCDGFVEGAKWRINNVWHSSVKKPEFGKLIVVKTIYGEYDLCYYEKCIWNIVMTWAYMKDLIPNTKD